jgi:hypothetical protein
MGSYFPSIYGHLVLTRFPLRNRWAISFTRMKRGRHCRGILFLENENHFFPWVEVVVLATLSHQSYDSRTRSRAPHVSFVVRHVATSKRTRSGSRKGQAKCNERSKLWNQTVHTCSRSSLSTHEWAFGSLLTLFASDSSGVIFPCCLPTHKEQRKRQRRKKIHGIEAYPSILESASSLALALSFLRRARLSTWVCSWRVLVASSITRPSLNENFQRIQWIQETRGWRSLL